ESEALGQEQVAHDVDQVATDLRPDVAEGPALEPQVLGAGEVPEPNVRDAANARIHDATLPQLRADALPHDAIGEALLRRAWTALLHPRWHGDQEARARPLVWIRVEGDVETLGPGVVDEPEHLLRRSREGRAVVEVGDVG